MRSTTLALVAMGLLVAGCTTPAAPDAGFAAMALAAPDLLAKDMGAEGTLQQVSGTMHVATRTTVNGDTMEMVMDMTMDQDIFVGGSTHMVMQMHIDGMGQSMDMTMHMACTPERMHVWSEGMPEGAEEMDIQIANPLGQCGDTSGMPDALATEVGQGELQVLQQAFQGSIPKLTYSTVMIEGGKAYAVYKTDLGMSDSGLGLTMDITTRATLDAAGRIASMVVSGVGDMAIDAGDQSLTMHMDISGDFDLSYGARTAMPAGLV